MKLALTPLIQVLLDAPAATTSPAGKMSVKEKVWPVALKFAVRTRFTVPPSVSAPLNALSSLTSPTTKVSCVATVLAGTLLVEVTPPIGMSFRNDPGVVVDLEL